MNRKWVTKAGIISLFVVVPLLVYGAVEVSLQQNFADLEKQYEIPSGILNKFAMVESNGNPNARASSSSAAGLFQWTTGSWTKFSATIFGSPLAESERFNPVMAARVTAYSIRHSKNMLGVLIQTAGVDMTVGLYMGHFLGEGGAATFLNGYVKQPSGIAACVLSKAASANPSIFGSCGGGKSFSEIVNIFAAKLKSPGVVNIAGNFGDSSGNSLAKSASDIPSAQYAPAGTVIPQTDPEIDGAMLLSTPATLTNTSPTTATTTPKTASTATKGSSAVAQSNTSGSAQTTSGVTPKTTSVGYIFAQPKIVTAGQNVLISVVTVNMNTTKPCAVVIQGKTHQVDYSQTGSYQTSQGDRGGLTFTLNCTDSSGSPFTTSDSVSVI